MNKNTNRKGFTIIEVVIAVSLFAIFVTGRFIIDKNSFDSYMDSVKTNNLELLISDLYAYLYTYKKTYGTSDFIHLITKGDLDNNCNGNDFNSNGSLLDDIDEYCFFYPYLSGTEIKFYQGIINNNNAGINNVYLLDNDNGGNDGLSYRKIFGKDNTLISIGLKEDSLNNDKYTGFIGIFDTDMLRYIYKQNVVFE